MGFKFSDNKIHFEFEGKTFKVDAAKCTVWLKTSLGVIQKAQNILKGCAHDADLTEEQIEEVLSGFVTVFDDLLGKGATKKIFGERLVSFYDCYDMYAYIVTEIKAFAVNKRKGVLDGGKELYSR